MGLGQMTPSDLVHINLTRLHHFSTMRDKFHSKIHNRFIGIHHSPPPLFPLPVYSNRSSIIIIHSSDQYILEVEQFTSSLEQSSCYISWPSLLWPNKPNYINRLDMTRTLVFGVHFVKENCSLRTKHLITSTPTMTFLPPTTVNCRLLSTIVNCRLLYDSGS